MADEDRGTGDPDHFAASDLEALYKLGAKDPRFRIRGSQLNKIIGGNAYEPDAWFVIDGKTVRRL